MVVVTGHQIVDSGAVVNGLPDPGETVELIATVRNFGSVASDVEITLSSTDPFITILDGSSNLGSLTSGQTSDNAADPFSFEVAANAPSGRIVRFSVLAGFAGGDSTSDLLQCIGRFAYLVWDPTGDRSSGPVIADLLDQWGFSGTISGSLPTDRLHEYASLWVSFGVYENNFVLESSRPEGPAIVDFMANGGCVYLEGGDVWAYDTGAGGFDFRPHFGLQATDDGTGDLSSVKGAPGQFTEGMDFAYAGENSYIDHLVPSGFGTSLFSNDAPAYDCGIAGDAGTYRTVGTSFELAGLVDGVEPSVKKTLVLEVMGFFGIAMPEVVFTDDFESGDLSAWQ